MITNHETLLTEYESSIEKTWKMETETTLPIDETDDDYGDENEKFVYYGTTFYKDLSPIVKKFLIEYFGERIYSFESDTYLKVEELIKDQFESVGDVIISLLYKNTTIPDEEEWEDAFDKFEGNNLQVVWPPNKPEWYHKPFEDDDDDDNFWNDIPESELTQDQKSAKEIVEMIDNGMIFNNGLQKFLNTGCPLLISDIHKYMEDTVPFYLSALTPEGYKLLQLEIENAAVFLYEDLFEVLFNA